MKPDGISRTIVDTFEIPESLAKELDELITKQVIRERLLMQVLLQGDDKAYEEAEKKLIPITSRIEAIKVKITRDFVPSQYNSQEYIWNYDGWEIDGNRLQIMKAE